MIELTTKPVVSSPLGIFAEGVFRVFGNFEKRCLFADDGSPIFTKPFPRDLMPGGTMTLACHEPCCDSYYTCFRGYLNLNVCSNPALAPLCDEPSQQERHDLVLNSFDKGNCLALEQVVLSVSILLIYKNLLIVYLEHVCCNTLLPAAYHQHEQDNNHPLLTLCTLAPYTPSMV